MVIAVTRLLNAAKNILSAVV